MPLFLVGVHQIKTQNLLLRRFCIGDAHNMFNNWASDPIITRYINFPIHNHIDTTLNTISDWIQCYEDNTFYNWAIEYNNEVIGSICVSELNFSAMWCEVGYCLAKKYWGRGIMVEALSSVIKYLFDEVNVYRIQAIHDVNNIASERVLQKVGMKYEGTLRKYLKNNSGIVDVNIYSILKTENT